MVAKLRIRTAIALAFLTVVAGFAVCAWVGIAAVSLGVELREWTDRWGRQTYTGLLIPVKWRGQLAKLRGSAHQPFGGCVHTD